ncbi:RING/U-box, partial [Neocallimastix californiae]
IKSWSSVALWKWAVTDEDDVCGICRNQFDRCCPSCKIPGDDCPLVWGQCRHCFHLHCMIKWLQTESSNQACPMDRRPWVYLTGDPNTAQNSQDQQETNTQHQEQPSEEQ